ncbi:MAG: META domain-containing protein [Candidatus Marinimicrobia bacterium]|nr:META domain-containing protein [Candidatus Neomarinimicrobiota bacterium]HOU17223.1 META domain-containing protein [Candidatus Neomarinimicrobiota bacterium]HQE94998.1 META domain-containing protein [Candidatus Neomarinimicrobiota bacterium]HQH55890.1 META domain-containing protein [Candidatus Neomarinimicrobiota bacterium]HQK11272.1 META domain-containing protein [Candidatus Neomarinimicrobiota bacterium]
MHNINYILMTLLLALGACSDSTSPNQNIPANLKNIWWEVQSFQSVTGEIITLAPTEDYFLLFGDSTIYGKSDTLCGNNYHAPYWIGGNDSLSIGLIISTEAWCRSNYWKYLSALQNATSYKINDNTLTIFFNDSKRILYTRRVE